MTQSPGASRSLADIQRSIAALQRRAVAHMHHTVERVLDAMDRQHKARVRAWRQSLCTKAACRRAGRCSGRTCEAPPRSN